jgi:hypothetical protein
MFGKSPSAQSSSFLTDRSISKEIVSSIEKEALKGHTILLKRYALDIFTQYIAPILCKHPTLKELDCSDFFKGSQKALSKSDKIASNTFRAMCSILMVNLTLESLTLDHAYVSDNSAKILAAGLRVGVQGKLVHVSMRYCQFESMKGIVDVLEAINVERFQLLDLYYASIGGKEQVRTLTRFEELLREWYISKRQPFDIYLLTHLVCLSELELENKLELNTDPTEEFYLLDEEEQKMEIGVSLDKQLENLEKQFEGLSPNSRAGLRRAGKFSPKHSEATEQDAASIGTATTLRMTRDTQI